MNFQKDQFSYSGGYLTYGPDRQFVARFKHRGMGAKRSDFVRLLTKYYTVNDYFTRLKDRAPMQILMDDGFVQFDLVNRRVLVAK